MGPPLPVFYDCNNCPSYCCSYVRIEVTDADVQRLARHVGVSTQHAREAYTKDGWEDGERIMRHQKDDAFGSSCLFLDTTTRLCTVHDGRPDVCRNHPVENKCGYYTLLMAERRDQDDPELIARAYNVVGEWPELEAADSLSGSEA